MKTKLIGRIAIVVIVVAITFNVNVNTESEKNLSLMSLSNLEALAGESSSPNKKCYQITHYNTELGDSYAREVYNCGSCSVRVKAHKYTNESTCS
ncbi:NVEALA domain-containing protein [Bacteroidales bacterium OttesenSCG-928-L03]|nr:NVEALA domain-containing protein [Bacteroidales bacterium OttesenSCG-928-L03]